MSASDRDDLNDMQRLLLMSAYVNHALPGIIPTANCGRVLCQALDWAGLWHADVRHDYVRDLENPIIESWYRGLINMIRHEPSSERLFDGAGNLGSGTRPPAYPQYTHCRLTLAGERLAAQLLAASPEEFRREKGVSPELVSLKSKIRAAGFYARPDCLIGPRCDSILCAARPPDTDGEFSRGDFSVIHCGDQWIIEVFGQDYRLARPDLIKPLCLRLLTDQSLFGSHTRFAGDDVYGPLLPGVFMEEYHLSWVPEEPFEGSPEEEEAKD